MCFVARFTGNNPKKGKIGKTGAFQTSECQSFCESGNFQATAERKLGLDGKQVASMNTNLSVSGLGKATTQCNVFNSLPASPFNTFRACTSLGT
eukprot:g15380.t1